MITNKKINENNMITIPYEIREAMDLKPGDIIEVDIIKKITKDGG